MPREIYEEITPAKDDPLKDWVEDENVRAAIELDEVIEKGYAPDLNEIEYEMMGKDPFLVAYAMMGDSRTVVTMETSKPKKLRANRHLPDVCKTMGVTWIDDFELYRRLNFRIKR